MNNKYNCCDRETAKWGAKKVVMIIGFTILGIALCILMGFVLMWLWNWLMPMIFNLPMINYWQAVGLFILAKIIFGGFGGGSSDDRRPKRRRRHPVRDQIKDEIEKEVDKEFDKYEGKNRDFEELYEKWWEEKGESSFREYMSEGKEDAE